MLQVGTTPSFGSITPSVFGYSAPNDGISPFGGIHYPTNTI